MGTTGKTLRELICVMPGEEADLLALLIQFGAGVIPPECRPSKDSVIATCPNGGFTACPLVQLTCYPWGRKIYDEHWRKIARPSLALNHDALSLKISSKN
jgi:hypothetical protein